MTVLERAFNQVYTKFKLNLYRRIFNRFEEREATLTAVETFCMEVIYALDHPTINQFAHFVQISQANAAYKVASLIKKGYITKERSTQDKREYHLAVTEKYMDRLCPADRPCPCPAGYQCQSSGQRPGPQQRPGIQ